VEVQKEWGSETRSFMIAGETISDICAIQQERFEIKLKTKIFIGHPTFKFKMPFNLLTISS